jgi:hypothetical protein
MWKTTKKKKKNDVNIWWLGLVVEIPTLLKNTKKNHKHIMVVDKWVVHHIPSSSSPGPPPSSLNLISVSLLSSHYPRKKRKKKTMKIFSSS